MVGEQVKKVKCKLWGKCRAGSSLALVADANFRADANLAAGCLVDDVAGEAVELSVKKFNKSSDWWKFVKSNPELKGVLDKLKKNGNFDFEDKANTSGSVFEKIKNKYNRTKVNYDCFGFPDFTPFVLNRIVLNGISRTINASFDIGSIDGCNSGLKCVDFVKANTALANKLGVPYQDFQILEHEGIRYTWHHHQDGKTMMLVPTSLNNFIGGASHPGGASLKKAFDALEGYELTGALPSPSSTKICD